MRIAPLVDGKFMSAFVRVKKPDLSGKASVIGTEQVAAKQ
jgi:hypothetical protein